MARKRQGGDVDQMAAQEEGVVDLREHESAPEMASVGVSEESTGRGEARGGLMSRIKAATAPLRGSSYDQEVFQQEASADLDRQSMNYQLGSQDPEDWEFDPRVKGGRGPSTVHLRRMAFMDEDETGA